MYPTSVYNFWGILDPEASSKALPDTTTLCLQTVKGGLVFPPTQRCSHVSTEDKHMHRDRGTWGGGGLGRNRTPSCGGGKMSLNLHTFP